MLELLMIMVIFAIVLSIIKIHYVTNDVNTVSMVWGILVFIVSIIKGEWLNSFIGAVISFVVVWLLFSLSSYLENSFFLRIIVLVFSMVVMVILLSYV